MFLIYKQKFWCSSNLVPGNSTYCILDAKWCARLLQGACPGEIDNACLIDGTSGILQHGVLEGQDFKIISNDIWCRFQAKYGGGPILRRRAIARAGGQVELELYGLELRVFLSGKPDIGPTLIKESKMMTIRSLMARICREEGLNEADVRLWDYFNQRKHQLLEQCLDRRLGACRMFQGITILV